MYNCLHSNPDRSHHANVLEAKERAKSKRKRSKEQMMQIRQWTMQQGQEEDNDAENETVIEPMNVETNIKEIKVTPLKRDKRGSETTIGSNINGMGIILYPAHRRANLKTFKILYLI